VTQVDIVIIGAGIAGASLAADLATDMSVVVVEREDHPGYHSTGRSAAIYTEAYGNETIRALTAASRTFFANPPEGFSEVPLWRDRGVLFVGRADQQKSLERHFEESHQLAKGMRQLTAKETLSAVPIFDKNYVAGGILEPEAMELDVDAIHSGFLRQMKKRGGQLVTKAEVTGLTRQDGLWTIETTAGTFEAKTVVNAAGAWVDKIAILAGTKPLGVKPMRRTAMTLPLGGRDPSKWPMVVDVDEQFYFKPEAGNLLGSPADESEVEPCDVQPEELDIAIAVDRIQKATTLEVKAIDHKWAGLRTFAPDRTTVVGFDGNLEGFFWLAGQGGYGIQTAPAMASASANLIRHATLPEKLLAAGITEAVLSPNRFR